MERKLIEEKSIQHLKLFAEVSEEARKEKLSIPPINEMVYWWTRKPLIVGRTVTLLSLLPSTVSIENVKPLLGLGKDRRAFHYTPSRQSVENLSHNNFDCIKILDPFAGAGNLIFEAARLGLDCTLIDYNPVAYLIMKATLEYPAKYGGKLAEDVKKYGEEVIKKVEKELGRFYERRGRKALHYLWCWCIRCPYCGQRVPLTNQMWLDKNRKIGYRIIPTEDNDFRVEIGILHEDEGLKYTQKGGEAVCIRCGNAISYNHMTKDIAERRDKEMIAVVVRDVKGKAYEPVSEEDLERFNAAKQELKTQWNTLESLDLIPKEELRESELFRVTNYGLKRWYEYFTERQLLLMCTLLKTIKEVCSEIPDREYAKTITTYLGFMLCKHISFNSIGVYWQSTKQICSNVLAMRRPSIVYNFAETNPFEKTSGSLTSMLKDIVKAIHFATKNRRPAEIKLGSALHIQELLSEKYDIIITDPPYMDDVPYGELSEFFYVWLIRLLREYFSDPPDRLPDRTPVDEDLVFSKGRFGGDSSLAMKFYKRGLETAFQKIHDVLKDDGLLVVFFAHSSTEAWELLLDILRSSKFRVVSSYAVHTESIANILAREKTSFRSSIVLACRKVLDNLDNNEIYFEALMPKVLENINELIEMFDINELLVVPITDLLIMVYGKVLEEFTRHAVIKSYREGFQPTFDNLIGEARDQILREIVKKLTGSSPTVLGPEASFSLIGKIFYRGLMSSDEALKTARAYGLSIDSLTKRGYVGKVKGGVKVRSFKEVSINKSPEEVDRNNIYEQLLYIEKALSQYGAARARSILQYPNFRVNELRSLVNVLIKHYRLLVNKGEELSNEEREELSILETLSDILRSPSRASGTLDSYL
jgi:adenine-specific DNA methylase